MNAPDRVPAGAIRVHLYRSGLSRQWRWRAVAANGRRMANGGESYRNRADCEAAVRALFAKRAILLHHHPGQNHVGAEWLRP